MTIEKNRAEKGCAYPLTPSELGMYIEHKMNPESYAYNINRAFEFTGDFDIEKWKRTFGKLVDLHENLRAYYIEEKGVPKRCVLPVLVPDFFFFEVERANVKAHIEKRQRPFDLSVAPLFELCFYKTETSVIFHLMIHHIIYDFGTETIFLEELKKLYSGEAVKGEDEGLNHFSCILEENPDTAFTTSAKAFFDTQFKEGIPENDMPTKGKRPDELPDGDTVARAYLDEKTTFDIGALAKKAGVSPYVVMLSAWALVISKYCDTEDLVVGVPHSGRRLKEAKTTGGMFVNTLPVRLKPVQKLTVIDYLKKTAETTRAFKKFQDYPLSQILKDLEVEHDPSRNPLYDVMFNFLAEGEGYEIENMTMKPFALPKQLIAIDLCMTAERIKTGFRIEIDYSKQLYDPVVVNNMMEQYLWVIKRMITAPECRLYEAAALPEDQLKVLTEDFGGERLTLPQNETIVSLFREQARRYPENPAVKFMGEQLSYKALNAQSDRLAQALKHLGIGASQVVGILIDRGPGMVIYPLSVLKTGAAYLPMIPSYPKERIEFMLEDSGASLLIVDDAYKDLAENFTGKIILSSQLKSLEAPAMALTDPSPEDHLLLLYTSGSTGTPKGCVFEHRNLVNYALWHCHEFEIDHNTTVSAYASFAFDASLMDLFAVLTCGGATCIVPEDMRLDLPAVNRYYEANDVNVAFFTTQLGRQFAMGMKNDKLRCLITGGETLVPPDKLPAYRLVNAYGPTETLVIIATFTIDGIYENVPIGSPTGNIRIYIMDKNGGLAPVGVAGELCIAGVQVGLGYLNRPE
ncbi:MAG: AMP-binding protein, partial [Eubacterium sp.]